MGTIKYWCHEPNRKPFRATIGIIWVGWVSFEKGGEKRDGRQASLLYPVHICHVCCAAQRGWLLSLGSCNFHLLLRGSPTHKYILFCCSEYRNSAISTKCMFLFVHWPAKGFHPHNVPYNSKDQGRLRITDMCFIWGLTISFMVEERCCVLTLSIERSVWARKP